MSPVHPLDSIPDPISAEFARFENSHADHDHGEIVVDDNDSDPETLPALVSLAVSLRLAADPRHFVRRKGPYRVHECRSLHSCERVNNVPSDASIR